MLRWITDLDCPKPSSEQDLVVRASPPKEGIAQSIFKAAVTTAGSTLHQVTGSLGMNAAEFTKDLGSQSFEGIFSGTPYRDLDYNSALEQFRADYQEMRKGISPETDLFQAVAKKIFMQPLWNQAYEVLLPYLFGGEDLDNSNLSFSEKFHADRICIEKKLSSEDGQGYLFKNFLKFRAKISLLDSHFCGNYPYLAGIRSVNGRVVHVLRHGVPIREWLDGSVVTDFLKKKEDVEGEKEGESKSLANSCVAEEYRAFLDFCKSNERKVLYCCLLNPNTGDERGRIKELLELNSEAQYQDVLHFIRIPADGFLTKALKKEENLEAYKNKIGDNLKSVCEWRDEDFTSWDALSSKDLAGFIPGSPQVRDVIARNYEALLDFSYAQIVDAYANDVADLSVEASQRLLKEKQQAFMMFFCALLRMCLIQELGITDYNNTCKDAIDRGAMHLVCDFLWDSYVTGNLKCNEDNLRVFAAWPAVMAKTQGILEDRAEWIVSFSNWIDRAVSQNLRKNILQGCQSLGLQITQNIQFSNECKSDSYLIHKIEKMQGPRECKVIIQADKEKFRRSIPEALRDYVIDNLPEILNKRSYYGITFQVAPESLNEITFISEDDEYITGEMGVADLGGITLEVKSSKGEKLAHLETSVMWKIAKEDLLKEGNVPVSLSIQSHLESSDGAYSVVGMEDSMDFSQSFEEILAKKAKRRLAIADINSSRHVFLEESGSKQNEAELLLQRKDAAVQTEEVSSRSRGFLDFIQTAKVRTRSQSDSGIDYAKPKPEVALQVSAEKSRTYRDWALVSIGVGVGAVGKWACSFFGEGHSQEVPGFDLLRGTTPYYNQSLFGQCPSKVVDLNRMVFLLRGFGSQMVRKVNQSLEDSLALKITVGAAAILGGVYAVGKMYKSFYVKDSDEEGV